MNELRFCYSYSAVYDRQMGMAPAYQACDELLLRVTPYYL